jgi:hypothetical protein
MGNKRVPVKGGDMERGFGVKGAEMDYEVTGRKKDDLWHLSNPFEIKGGENGRRKEGKSEGLGCNTRIRIH